MNISSLLQQIFSDLNLSLSWTNVIEIGIIALTVFIFYQKIVKNTQTERFVKGSLLLILIWIFSEILTSLDLRILGMFFKSIVGFIALSLIVIFQPELRRFLGAFGQTDFINKFFSSSGHMYKNQKIDIIKELIESVKYFAKSHTGALIVFQNDLSNTYHDVGTTLNADVSTELLLTIFHPNTPLHDGAVVISDSKIISAGVLLPLTEDPKLSWKYGTRHRAAIGMSEVSDAVCLVISEETGDVSIAMGGELKKYDDLITLKTDLESILGIKPIEVEKKNLFNKLMDTKKE